MINDAIAQFFNSWKEKKQTIIDWKDNDGTYGNPKSLVQIVEFSDFECPHCSKAAFTLHAALRPVKDKIFFVFKNFPLDSSCNPSIPYKLHQNACNLARLAYCAKRKNKFWEFHDLIFLKVSNTTIREGMVSIKKALSDIFTEEEINTCLQDKKSLKNITQDIETGKRLGIRGTPSIYINGKLVTIPLTVETLRKLVTLETSLQKK